MLAELFMGLGASGVSIDNKFLGQQIFFVEIQETRVGLFLGQISTSSDHNNREDLLFCYLIGFMIEVLTTKRLFPKKMKMTSNKK